MCPSSDSMTLGCLDNYQQEFLVAMCKEKGTFYFFLCQGSWARGLASHPPLRLYVIFELQVKY